MKVFLDDIRKPTDVKQAWYNGQWVGFPSLYSWVVLRTYNEFVAFINKNGLPELISFDHDLSWEHYPQDQLSMIQPIDYSKFKEKTGYDAAKWLTEYCIEKNLPLPDFYVHSFNPVGRANIIGLLRRFQEVRPDLKVKT